MQGVKTVGDKKNTDIYTQTAKTCNTWCKGGAHVKHTQLQVDKDDSVEQTHSAMFIKVKHPSQMNNASLINTIN